MCLVGEMSVGDVPVGEMFVGEVPVGEISLGNYPDTVVLPPWISQHSCFEIKVSIQLTKLSPKPSIFNTEMIKV